MAIEGEQVKVKVEVQRRAEHLVEAHRAELGVFMASERFFYAEEYHQEFGSSEGFWAADAPCTPGDWQGGSYGSFDAHLFWVR